MIVGSFVLTAPHTRSHTQATPRTTKGPTTGLRVHLSLRPDVGSESSYAAFGFRGVVSLRPDSRSRHERAWVQEAHGRHHPRRLRSVGRAARRLTRACGHGAGDAHT